MPAYVQNRRTLEELHIRNARAHARFLVAVVARSEAELLEPRLPGGWTVKDVLGAPRMVRLLAGAHTFSGGRGIRSESPPRLAEIVGGDATLDEINARIFAHNAPRSLTEVRRVRRDRTIRAHRLVGGGAGVRDL